MENRVLKIFKDGQVAWINELMQKCGVISSEQPVQEHTCIVTDAKKREYPFHKVDRPGTISKKRDCFWRDMAQPRMWPVVVSLKK